ncbi:M3 family metallopeptidase [Rugamonas sp. CCM 8940]|uniref:M3 family metallopeptidase n=1 Tax=Rugamonas sp. CCM 8940 TaxID=2765359 RepID=UPI0018F49741|nr:M3 family metallopeptidase [Rugamonas sp. CCM 8940]MBJ7313701.1 M3 family oligoendopeptidase [Rugamonas sp. CCM 8940]
MPNLNHFMLQGQTAPAHRRPRKSGVQLALAAVLWACGVSAPAGGLGASTMPAAPALRSYALDLSRYFSTPEAQAADLAQCVAESDAFPAAVSADPAVLVERLRSAEDLMARLRRHIAYFKIEGARDIEDHAAKVNGGKAIRAKDKVDDAVRAMLLRLGNDGFERAVAARPELRKYAYLAEKAARDKAHELPKAEQSILDEMEEPAASAFWSIYQQAQRSTPYAKIETKLGVQDVGMDAAKLSLNPDREIRRAAWQQRWQGLASRADVYAGILLGVVRLKDTSARLAKFPDAPTAVYFNRHLKRADVDQALEQVARHAELQKRFQRLRAARISRFSGISDVHSWDLELAPPGLTPPRLTLDETRAMVPAALAPLGRDYVAHFQALLDPVNARMDIASEGGKRVNDGFSISAVGVPSGLFIQKYNSGATGDSRVVIHEGGHAVHGQLMNEAGVSQFYLSGPNWMSEAYPAINEILMYEYLAKQSKDPAVRAFYLEAGLRNLMFQIFGSAQEATLEQTFYDGVIAGSIKNAADFDAVTAKVWERYEIWPTIDPELRHVWITRRLMFQDPLYLVNYLYSGLIAAKMFDMLQADPLDFQQRHGKLLRTGFNDDPAKLLKEFFGRELSQRELVDGAVNVLSKKLDELEMLYRQLEAAGK